MDDMQHVGRWEAQAALCLLVRKQHSQGYLLASVKPFHTLTDIFQKKKRKGETVLQRVILLSFLFHEIMIL